MSQLSSSRAELLSELERCRSDLKVAQESHTNQLQALERENDLLRDQLKKYVGMVNAHRRESSAKSTENVAQATATSGTAATGEAASHEVQGEGSGRQRSVSPLQQVEQRLAEVCGIEVCIGWQHCVCKLGMV